MHGFKDRSAPDNHHSSFEFTTFVVCITGTDNFFVFIFIYLIIVISYCYIDIDSAVLSLSSTWFVWGKVRSCACAPNTSCPPRSRRLAT